MTDFTGGSWRSLITGDKFSSMPGELETQWRFEDDSDTTLAIDSIGSNDGDIGSGASYTTESRCGSLALDSGADRVVSQTTIDLVAKGNVEGASLLTFVNPATTSDFTTPISWGPDTNNFVSIQSINGSWVARMQIAGTDYKADSGVSVDDTSYQHIVVSVDQSELWVIINGTEQARVSHSEDITSIGSANLYLGDLITSGNQMSGLYDNASYANGPLVESDADELINQC